MSGRHKHKRFGLLALGRLMGWPLLFFAAFSLRAQDLHYSLYSFTPLNLNPALVAAGTTPEAFFIYRRMGMGPAADLPISQIGLSHPLFSNGRKWGGVGLQLSERAGDQASPLRQQWTTAAAAYHLRLSYRQSMSLGFSGSFGKSMSATEAKMPGENFRSQPRNTFKLNSGLFYQVTDQEGRETFYLSLALMQASLPEENFTFYHKVPSTFLLAGGFTLWQNEFVAVMPQIMWNNRAGRNFVNAGGKIRTSLEQLNAPLLNREGSLEFGFGYIREQALVLSLSLLQPLYQLGFSYDFPAHQAVLGGGYRRGPEMALRIFPEKVVQRLKERESGATGREAWRLKRDQVLPLLQPKSGPILAAEPESDKIALQKKMGPEIIPGRLLKGRQKQVDESFFEGRHLYFEPSQNAVEAEEGKQFLQNLVNFLQQHPALTVRIVGHTDDTGSKDANILLSFRRAQVISDVLVAAGILEERVVVEGHGSFNPLVPNSSDRNRAKNRRVEVFIDQPSVE